MAVDQQPPYGPPSHSWGGPPPGYYPPPSYVVPTSGLAVASLVCSLVGLVTFGVVAVAGVICGHAALGETKSGRRGGHGMAIAGLIIGWIQVGLWLAFLFLMLVGGLANL